MNIIDATEIYYGKLENIKGNYYTDVFYKGIRVGSIKFSPDSTYTILDTNCKEIDSGVYENTNDIMGIKTKEAFVRHIQNSNKTIVWFNTWFSSIKITIEQLREAFPNITFIGSNKEADCAYSSVVHEFFQEPTGLSPEEYVDFALETCAKYGITVFFPKAYAKTISKHVEDFETLGVKVIYDDYKLVKQFDSKELIYKLLESLNYDKVPEYSVANNSEDFIEQYNKYSSTDETVCVKFDKDEGAASFRVVSDKHLAYESMQDKLENILTHEDMLAILKDGESKGKFKPLMVMPKILSPEVSVDCYNSSQLGFIAIPRYKIGNRVKEIKLNQELIDDCKRLLNIFDFKSAFNIQYRWTAEGEPKLLEINTRLSGGIHLTTMCGFSIPKQMLADILGVDSGQKLEDIKEVRVTQYETPIML